MKIYIFLFLLFITPIRSDTNQSDLIPAYFYKIRNQILESKSDSDVSKFSDSFIVFINSNLYEKNNLTLDAIKKIIDAFLIQHDYKSALSLQLKLIELDNDLNGPELSGHLQNVQILASIYRKQAMYKEALEINFQALDYALRVSNTVDSNVVNIINNVGLLYIDLERFNDALIIYKFLLSLSEKVFGINSENTASVINNISLTLLNLGKYDEATTFQLKALEIQENLFGKDDLKTLTSINNLAGAKWGLGNYLEAKYFLEKSLVIKKKHLDPFDPTILTGLTNLATLNALTSDYVYSLQNYEEALEISKKINGINHPFTGKIFNGLGVLNLQLGDHESAIENLKKAIDINKNFFEENSEELARNYNNLSNVYIETGSYEDALKYSEKSLNIKYENDNPIDIGISLNTYARIYDKLGENDVSAEYQQKALDIFVRNLDENHSYIATSLANIGYTEFTKKNYEIALVYQLKALIKLQKNLDTNNTKIAFLLRQIAETKLALGDVYTSLTILKYAVNIYQSHREGIANIGEPNLKLFTDSISGTFQLLASLLVEQGRFAEAQKVLEMLKEDEFFEFVRRESNDNRLSRIEFTSTEENWNSRFSKIAENLAALSNEEKFLTEQEKLGLGTQDTLRLNKIKKEIKVAEDGLVEYLTNVRKSLSAVGPSKKDEIALTSLQSQRELQKLISNLGKDVVLLQYFVTDKKLETIITTSNTVIPVSTNINVKDLNRLIFEFRKSLRDPKSDFLPLSKSLYQLLLAPVTNIIGRLEAKTVMLSLDGQLRHIPFGALHNGSKFAVELWNMPIYTSLTKEKLIEKTNRDWRVAGLGVTQEIGDFKALPAVKKEMDSLITSSGFKNNYSEIYLDQNFTVTRLQDVGRRNFQLMHIASHFSVSPGTEINSFLLLGDGNKLTLSDIRKQNIRFHNVDLLTLSACETGLGGGRDSNGREIDGLAIISQKQGAKSVIATLWPVADKSTAELMSNMYKLRNVKNLTKIEALRQAQLKMLFETNYKHPFYWAPYILFGNWH